MIPRDVLERFDPRSSWPGFLIMAGLGASLALAALGPSASSGLSPTVRLAYWMTHVLPAIGILAAVQAGLQRVAQLDRVSPWLIVALAGLLGALLFTPIAFGLDWVFPTVDDDDDLAPEPVLMGLMGEFGDLLLPFLLIWTGFNATRLLQIDTGRQSVNVSSPGLETDPNLETGQSQETDDFWSRIPAHLGRDLVAMTSELHYLRVYTREGNTLILHAFGRALESLGEVDGMRIHRSHWVALGHVQALRRDGEKVFCRLDNGMELPVSRPYRAQLRARLRG